MKKLQKSAAMAVAMLSVGGLIAGCGTNQATTPTPTTTSSSQTHTINFANASGTIVWAAPPITHTGLRNALIAAFEKKYPKIKVQLQSQSNNTDTNRASLSTAIGGGSSTPDVYMGDVIWPAQFAHAQLALPLNTVLPASFWSRFSKGLVQGATYKGNVYAAPFFADSGFLYYRKDLLEKAHLPVPTTWAQLKQEAQELQKKGLVQYGFVWQGASYEGLTCDFQEYLADAGGSVLNAQGQPTIDSPQALKALDFMRSLITSGVSPTAEDTFQESESMNVFDQGKAAFLRNWTYAWANSQNPSDSQVVGKVGVTVLPSFNGGAGYSTIGGWDLYVNPHSKNLPADLAFINWMTGKQAQTILAVQFTELPTNAAVASSPEVQNVSPVFKLVNKMHFISRPDQTPNYPQISQALYTNVNAALSGTISPKKALKNAQQQMQQAVGSGGGL
ncbi:ABC transporter substrate-binding protein [Sulfoacidibacillus thermotolerans]|uniref:Sugar ABC transporter substrate-binding protein n=1 Tax=Sulfoacidibacillus thermotolerans TaxID=1765684 RepID=A0A2U3D825_SULT2|nr:ABC transporter substrate-binding protein [Sulfoacidibacillus thermotolerans]PWI57428.1 sugar ABC transporter substrate-binding protein [Sulfoacidibacillus thermotolerans]